MVIKKKAPAKDGRFHFFALTGSSAVGAASGPTTTEQPIPYRSTARIDLFHSNPLLCESRFDGVSINLNF
jgi:hypothetical protein